MLNIAYFLPHVRLQAPDSGADEMFVVLANRCGSQPTSTRTNTSRHPSSTNAESGALWQRQEWEFDSQALLARPAGGRPVQPVTTANLGSRSRRCTPLNASALPVVSVPCTARSECVTP